MLHNKVWQWFRSHKWVSYIWLIYVPFNLLEYLPLKNEWDVIWVVMCAIFVVIYIMVVEFPHYRFISVPLEMLVGALFSIVSLNNYMIIFTAWQVPFILIQTVRGRRIFPWFLTLYEVIILISFVRYGLTMAGSFNWESDDVVGAIFPLISPVMAYFFSSQIFANRSIHQANQRLEAVIQRDERERIARDLHDTLGQSFSMITIKTELAKKLLVKAPDRVASELADIEATSRQNLQLVRSIVNNLHQQSLSEMLVEQNKALKTAEITLVTLGEAASMQWPTRVQNRLAAVIQEALTNVIRHAHAGQVVLTFSQENKQYKVVIQDDGNGHRYERRDSNGLLGMRQRMEEVQGTFSVTTNRIGTLVTLTMPRGKTV